MCPGNWMVVVDVVVLTLIRIIKSVVTVQVRVTLEMRNTAGKNTNNLRGGRRIYHSWRNSCLHQQHVKVRLGVSLRCARTMVIIIESTINSSSIIHRQPFHDTKLVLAHRGNELGDAKGKQQIILQNMKIGNRQRVNNPYSKQKIEDEST